MTAVIFADPNVPGTSVKHPAGSPVSSPSAEPSVEAPPALAPVTAPSPEASPLPAVPTITVTGKVREKGTQKPVGRISVYAFPEGVEKPLKTTTDPNGSFKIDLPPGKFHWLISASGYERLEEWDEQEPDGPNHPRTLYALKISYDVYETTVVAKEDNRDDKTKTLTQQDFLTMPGANGDPVKAVQNLPGVNRANAFGAQVIIEGSAPQDTKYSIDTQNVPLIFHFTGLSSVVIPEAVDRVDYLSAGYGPEFGQSISGLVNLYTRSPKTDAPHGFAFVDLLNAGGLLEGPITEHSSFLIGGRQSYIGAVLKAALKNNSSFNLTVAPDFEDLIAQFQVDFSPADAFKFVAFGSSDSLGFVLPQPANTDPSIRGSFSDSTSFFRLIPQFTHKFDGGLTSRFWLGFGRDWFNINAGNFYANSNDYVLSGRAELEHPISVSWKAYYGLQEDTSWANVSFTLPIIFGSGGVLNPISVSQVVSETRPYTTSVQALYWRNIIHLSDSAWTFLPGVRLDYVNQTNQVLPQPRVAVRYALSPSLTLRSAGGLYVQAPQPQQLDPTYGNPGLHSEEAWHITAGFEKDFRGGSSSGFVGSMDGFYKYLYNMVIPSTAFTTPSQPEYFNNNGIGHIAGIELLAKYASGPWSGWLAYTLSRSTRTSPPAAEALFAYDQTHAITMLGSVELGNNWKLSGRIRYITGDPFTDINSGTLDIDNDVYIPVYGALYTDRLSPFFEVDVRFDKKWIYNTWILSAYLDIENLTNTKNPEQINYSYDYSQKAVITGIPFLPTLGVKGEF